MSKSIRTVVFAASLVLAATPVLNAETMGCNPKPKNPPPTQPAPSPAAVLQAVILYFGM